MTHRDASKQSGFTLIEVIAELVIVAVFSAFILLLLSDKTFVKSMDSVRRFSKSSAISEVMANIMMDYEPYPKWKKATSYSAVNKVFPTGMNGRFYICTLSGTSGTTDEPLWRDSGETQDGGTRWESGIWKKQTAYVVGDMVIPTTPNGHFYRCTGAGTSGDTEPTWPTKLTDPAAADGSVQWVRLLEYLYLQIGAEGSTQNNNYGEYNIVKNRFVKFVSNVTIPISTGEPENVLEVQIRNDEGDTLTTLFTAQIN